MTTKEFTRDNYLLSLHYTNDEISLNVNNIATYKNYTITKTRDDYRSYTALDIDIFTIIISLLSSDAFELIDDISIITVLFIDGPVKITLILNEVLFSEKPEICDVVHKLRTEYDAKLHKLEMSTRVMIDAFREEIRGRDAEIAALSRYVIIEGIPIIYNKENIIIVVLSCEGYKEIHPDVPSKGVETNPLYFLYIKYIEMIEIIKCYQPINKDTRSLGIGNSLDHNIKSRECLITPVIIQKPNINCIDIISLKCLKKIVFINTHIINIMSLLNYSCEELHIFNSTCDIDMTVIEPLFTSLLNLRKLSIICTLSDYYLKKQHNIILQNYTFTRDLPLISEIIINSTDIFGIKNSIKVTKL